GPLRHASYAIGRHVLIGRQADDVSRGGWVGHRQADEMGLLHVDEQARLEVALIRQANANATARGRPPRVVGFADLAVDAILGERSEEHTSELQSRGHLVCRLLLEKKNQTGLGSVPRRSR